MKYRILQDEKGFRAQVELYSDRNKQKYFEYIENDGSLYYDREHYYDSVYDAIAACKEHHIKKGYDKIPKVVEEFEL